jgi:hypothetical protein
VWALLKSQSSNLVIFQVVTSKYGDHLRVDACSLLIRLNFYNTKSRLLMLIPAQPNINSSAGDAYVST